MSIRILAYICTALLGVVLIGCEKESEMIDDAAKTSAQAAQNVQTATESMPTGSEEESMSDDGMDGSDMSMEHDGMDESEMPMEDEGMDGSEMPMEDDGTDGSEAPMEDSGMDE